MKGTCTCCGAKERKLYTDHAMCGTCSGRDQHNFESWFMLAVMVGVIAICVLLRHYFPGYGFLEDLK